MRPCPRCGSPPAQGALVCGVCGTRLDVAASPPSSVAKHTMLGVSAHAPPAASVAGPPASALGKQTMIGGVGMPPPASAATPRAQHTMIGMSAPQPSAPLAPPAPLATHGSNQTMIGMPAAGPGADAVPVSRPLPSAKHTMLGVAVPGIAPLRPGVAAPEPRFGGTAVLDPAELVARARPAAPEPALDDDEIAALRAQARAASRVRKLGVAILATAGGLVVGALVAYRFWPSAPPVSANVATDASGRETLHLVCSACPDGTTLAAGPTSAVFAHGEADLALGAPLRVGENDLRAIVKKPGGSDEQVRLAVPLAYRVRTDATGIGGDPPNVVVRVEAPAGSKVGIDGKPVSLDASGVAAAAIDLTADGAGPADETRTVEKSVAWEITPAGGASSSGRVGVRVPVAALRVDAPGAATIVETSSFLVAGRASKNASVTVAGRAIPVGADGTFAQMMSISAPGETDVDVRALVPGHAPRVVRVHLRRVASLAAEAREADARTHLEGRALFADPGAHVGSPVVVVGEVVEANLASHRASALVDVAAACDKPPCLARVVRAGDEPFARGERVRVYGALSGAVDAAGAPVAAGAAAATGVVHPDVAASFVLKAR